MSKKKNSPSKNLQKGSVLADSSNFESLENEKSTFNFFKGKEVYITILLVALAALIVFKDFLFFENVFLYKDIGSDTLNGLYPPMLNNARYLHEHGFPSWSFSYGMGQNILPLFLHDPFDFLLYFLSEKNLVFGIAFKEYFKILLAGLTFFYYLRTLKLTTFTCVIGSLMFSFTGFMILGGGWYLFSFEALNFAFLLLAFEKLYQQKFWYLFPLAIFGIAISMPFNLYVYGLFLFVYATLRVFEDQENNVLKTYLKLMFSLLLFGLIGLALSSVFLVENVIQLLDSPRGQGGNSYYELLSSKSIFTFIEFKDMVTAFFRLFSSDLLGTGNDFKGTMNYLEAPLFYSGLLTLLVFPQFFLLVNKRRKIIYTFFLVLFIFPIFFPYFRQAFWLFTGDYYRAFSFLVSFSLLFTALRAISLIDLTKKLNVPVLIGTILVLLIGLSINYFPESGNEMVNRSVLNFVRAFLLFYTVLLVFFNRANSKIFAKITLILFVFIECSYLSSITVNERDLVSSEELKEKTGYNDYSIEALNFIKKKDNGFYRIDKNYFSSTAMHASLNDALVHDYKGTSSYHSFNQLHYINFLKEVGMVDPKSENASRWANGLENRQILESVTCVKYFLDKNGTNPFLKIVYDSIAQFGDVKVLKNKFFMPLGVTYDELISQSDYRKCRGVQKDISLLQRLVISDENVNKYISISKFNLKDTTLSSQFSPDTFNKIIATRKSETLKISKLDETIIEGQITVSKDKIMYLAIPFDKNWNILDNDKKAEIEIVNGGLMAVFLKKGAHQIQLKYEHRFLNTTTLISLVTLFLYLGFVVRAFLLRNKSKKMA